jgi:Retron-type reverse transcriptase
MKEKQRLMQPTEESGSCTNNRVEPEGMSGVQTYMRITENTFTPFNCPEDGLLEFILSPENLNRAYKQVKRNKGSGGVDSMEVKDLLPYLLSHKEELIESLYAGKYRPNPVRRVEIPKSNGKKRMLGIPTVVDRLIQQSISQVLSLLYEPRFSPTSYGFRPGRSAHDALRKCREYISEGYLYTLDMDLEKFFDTVSHSKLIEVLSRTIKDGRVLSLIHKYLNAGLQIENRRASTFIGVPQGGPLSPLLSNIILNELDKELENRGHKYVRYADDVVIFCKSRKSAHRTFTHILPFIEKKLYLKVNKDKTVVAHYRDIEFLSYSFGRRKGKVELLIPCSTRRKMRAKIRELTNRSNGWGNDYRKSRLEYYVRGWINYFRLAHMRRLLSEIDEWLRRRIRMVIWKQWKRIKTRSINLRKLGIKESQSWRFANTRKGYWRVSVSPILTTSITDERLRQSGYLFFSDYYRTLKL